MAKKKANVVAVSIPTMNEYVAAFCDAPNTRKAVMDLSSMLARVVGQQIREALPKFELSVGEKAFGGSVAQHHLDAHISNEHLGLQLGIDVKGLNSGESVGKNWNNRIGDFHAMATNHHSTSPKAVMGGVLAIPFEGITARTHKKIEESMLNMQGRVSWNNHVSQFEGLALMVIHKTERRLMSEFPAAESPLRIEKFAATLAECLNQRFKK